MTACERCWADARVRSRINGRPVTDNYTDLLAERRNNPCPQEPRTLHPTFAAILDEWKQAAVAPYQPTESV